MRMRELQGGRAALAALAAMPLRDDASTLNGSSPHARPAGGYVWEDSYVEASPGDAAGDGAGDAAGGASDGHGGERLLEGELRKAQARAAAARQRR